MKQKIRSKNAKRQRQRPRNTRIHAPYIVLITSALVLCHLISRISAPS